MIWEFNRPSVLTQRTDKLMVPTESDGYQKKTESMSTQPDIPDIQTSVPIRLARWSRFECGCELGRAVMKADEEEDAAEGRSN